MGFFSQPLLKALKYLKLMSWLLHNFTMRHWVLSNYSEQPTHYWSGAKGARNPEGLVRSFTKSQLGGAFILFHFGVSLNKMLKVEKNVDEPVIWDAIVLMWGYCHDRYYACCWRPSLHLSYRQTFDTRRTKSQHVNVSCLVLQLTLPNPLKPVVKSRMKMQLEQRRSAMLQLHLRDQQFYCPLRCDLYWRFDGNSAVPLNPNEIESWKKCRWAGDLRRHNADVRLLSWSILCLLLAALLTFVLPSNIWYKAHEIPTRKCFLSSIAVDFAQSIEASC